MMDLENRLRSTFTEMADEQPPSADPRGDLERRLATRGRSGWRTPVLVAAAAAVVAAVAVPVVVFSGSGGSGSLPAGSAGTQPNTQSSEPGESEFPMPDRGEGRDPMGGYRDNGTFWSFFAIAGGVEVCSAEADLEALTCSEAQFGEPPEGHAVLTFALDPANGPMGSKTLFVSSPQVATLEVRDSAGANVGLVTLGPDGGGTPSIYMADFGGPADGFGYTAKDADGNVIEEALT